MKPTLCPTLIVSAMLLPGLNWAGQSTEECLAGKPSVLFIGPSNYVEPTLARELMQAGYSVAATPYDFRWVRF